MSRVQFRIMTSKEKVSCRECGEDITAPNMEGHTNLHAGKRPFKCTLCPKAYPSNWSCCNHYWLIHGIRRRGEPTQEECPTELGKHHEPDELDSASHTNGLELGVSVPVEVNVCSNAVKFDCGTVNLESTGDCESVIPNSERSSDWKQAICESSTKQTHSVGKCNELRQRTTVRAGSKGKPFQCSQCNRAYRQRQHLTRHCRNMHSKLFQCNRCSLGYRKESTLVTHYRMCHSAGARKLVCSECGNCYSRKDTLAKHCKMKHKGHGCDPVAKGKLECSECGNCYSRRDTLAKHCRTKHNGRGYDLIARDIFQCSKCGQHFTSGVDLVRHCQHKHGGLGCAPSSTGHHTQENTTSMETPRYLCPCCDLTFHSLKSYKNHLFSHSSTTTVLQCTVCGREYCSVSELWQHQTRTHWDYQDKQLLHRRKCFTGNRVGQKSHHQIQFKKAQPSKKRTNCNKMFKSASALYNHPCDKRNSMGSETNMFSRPKEVDTQTPAMSLDPVVVPLNTASGHGYKCALCGKVLTRMLGFRGHMNLHTGARPYVCEVCGMTFPHYHQCLRHMMKHKKGSELAISEVYSILNPHQQTPHQQTKARQVKHKKPSEPLIISEAHSSPKCHQMTKKQVKRSSNHAFSSEQDTTALFPNGEVSEMTPSPQPSHGEDMTSAATLDNQCFNCGMCGVSLQHYAAYMEHMDQHTEPSNPSFPRSEARLWHQELSGSHLFLHRAIQMSPI